MRKKYLDVGRETVIRPVSEKSTTGGGERKRDKDSEEVGES